MTYLSSLVGAALLVAPAARGQARPRNAGSVAAARELFADATELEAHSQWSPAAAKLKSALDIKETPGLRYHLAHCEEQLGSYVEALSDYDRAAELIREGSPAPDVEPLLPLAQRRLESRIAKLDLVVPAGTTAAAELDERALPASAIGTSIRLDPGVHHVIVHAVGHADYRAYVSLSIGEHRTVKVFFPDPAPASSPVTAAPEPTPSVPTATIAPARSTAPPAAEHRASSGVRTALLVGEAAVTVVGAGLGVGFAAARPAAARRARSAQANVPDEDEACADNAYAGCAELLNAISAYRRDVHIEVGGFIGAGVGAALFAATWAFWPSGRKEAAAVTVEPAAGGAVLSARGVF